MNPIRALGILVLLSPTTLAEDPAPGSVLVYPSLRDTVGLSVISLTNVHPSKSVYAHFSYVGVTPGSGDPFSPDLCEIGEAFEVLTPLDTITITVRCHNPLAPIDGYLLVEARDATGSDPIAHDFLVGSQLVVQNGRISFSLPAISIPSPQQEGMFTDVDLDGELDFDGIEYAMTPGTLVLDSFLATAGNRLALINLTGGIPFDATVALDVYNDNEQPVSVTRTFRCWVDQPVDTWSFVFSSGFLLSTAHDPSETDVTCNGVGDVENGWASVRGLDAASESQVILDPAMLGAVTGGPSGLERGRPLWRLGENSNGDFLGEDDVHHEF